MTANFKGIRKGEGVSKSGLTTADKAWIAGLICPINDRLDVIEKDVSEINDRLDVLEEDVKNVKEDIKAIKECSTIKKELKKDDE